MRDIQMIENQRDGADFRLNLRAISFDDIYEMSMTSVQQDFKEKEQTVESKISEELPKIWADEVRLKQILTNFLTNANKYTPEKGVINVGAEVAENIWDEEGARQVLHIWVKDDGLGISEEDQKKLFVKYFRSTNQRALDEKGTGLGLALTKRLIEFHGGTIWFESELNKGTTFHFTIPLASEILEQNGVSSIKKIRLEPFFKKHCL